MEDLVDHDRVYYRQWEWVRRCQLAEKEEEEGRQEEARLEVHRVPWS